MVDNDVLGGWLEATQDQIMVESVAVLGDGDILVAKALLQHTPSPSLSSLSSSSPLPLRRKKNFTPSTTKYNLI